MAAKKQEGKKAAGPSEEGAARKSTGQSKADGARAQAGPSARAKANSRRKQKIISDAGTDRAGKASQKNNDPEKAGRKQDSSVPNCIVGIGASAGGLEAFSELLRSLPNNTGMAFVLIQHLDPHHESMMTEILSRETRMPVEEAADGVVVEPDHIYMIPPNTDLAILDGRLSLMERAAKEGLHHPIDYFMRSLARDQGSKAIGIILSGTVNDGVMGMGAIKQENGITFAQDPKTARYDGMPRSAIDAAVVDFVLPVKEIAEWLARLNKHPFARRALAAHAAPDLISDRDFQTLEKIFITLRDNTGVDFSHYKRSTTMRRISRRMVMLRIDSVEDYLKHLVDNPDEAKALFNDILISVTSFFRDPEIFDVLKKDVLPVILKHHEQEAIRVWVPGCSTGEEAYSLAITVYEFLESRKSNIDIQVFGTDINDAAIDRARQGIFPEGALVDVPKQRRENYFDAAEGGYRVKKKIRDLCLFARHDITHDPPFSRLDLISFRNVMIYMDRPLQKRVVPMLHYALQPWGYILLGSSESLEGYSEYFNVEDAKHRLYTRKAGTGRLHLNVEMAEPYEGQRPLNFPAVHLERPFDFDLQKEVNKIIMDRFAPAGVLVNDNFEIIQFQGRTGAFLEPAAGKASLSLLNMLKNGLVLTVRSAIESARKTGNHYTAKAIKFEEQGLSQDVNVDVNPFKGPNGELYYLVLFTTQGEPAQSGKPAGGKAGETSKSEKMRQELVATKDYLQSVISEKERNNEELRAANEEIQSSNEELQSMNEELQTAKEELQSTNEELRTVNDELQSRNQDLTQAIDDLANVSSNVGAPVLVLGSDSSIRLFTPGTDKVINVTQSDIGRPVTDLNLRLNIDNLEEMITSVISTLAPVEQTVKSEDGHWYSVTMRPYRTSGNKIDGVVMSLLNIDDLMQNLKLNETLAEVDGLINSARGINQILGAAMEIAAKCLGAGAAMVTHREQGNWRVEHLLGLPKEIQRREYSSRELKSSNLAVKEENSISVENTASDSRVNRRFMQDHGIKSLLAVPLMVRGEEPFGTIDFFYLENPRKFPPAYVEFAERLASSLSLSIENARLYSICQGEGLLDGGNKGAGKKRG